MMKIQRIDVQMSTATLDNLSDTIKHVETEYRKGAGYSFFLQVFSSGHAHGIALPREEGTKLKHLLKEFWEKGEKI